MKTCEVRRFSNHLFWVDSEADPLPDDGDFPPGDRVSAGLHAAHQAVQHLVHKKVIIGKLHQLCFRVYNTAQNNGYYEIIEFSVKTSKKA